MTNPATALREALKPCPFCGSEPVIAGRDTTAIFCGNDQCMIYSVHIPFNNYGHRADAIATWNRRALLAEGPRIELSAAPPPSAPAQDGSEHWTGAPSSRWQQLAEQMKKKQGPPPPPPSAPAQDGSEHVRALNDVAYESADCLSSHRKLLYEVADFLASRSVPAAPPPSALPGLTQQEASALLRMGIVPEGEIGVPFRGVDFMSGITKLRLAARAGSPSHD